MLRSFFEFHDTCLMCGLVYSPGEGEFTFAIIVSLFLVILAALPAYIAFDAWTGWGPNGLAAATLVFVSVLYAWLYRHVKAAWYGWMID